MKINKSKSLFRKGNNLWGFRNEYLGTIEWENENSIQLYLTENIYAYLIDRNIEYNYSNGYFYILKNYIQ